MAIRSWGTTNSDGSVGNWFQRTFDPQYTEQVYNAFQAEVDRRYNSEEAEKQRAFDSAEAQKQRDYEERLSSTAYQRAAEDMRSVGLNPYAVYGGASAAAVPSGASAHGSSASASGARVGGHSSLVGTVIGSAFNLAATAVSSRNYAQASKQKAVSSAYRLATELLAAYAP